MPRLQRKFGRLREFEHQRAREIFGYIVHVGRKAATTVIDIQVMDEQTGESRLALKVELLVFGQGASHRRATFSAARYVQMVR